MSGALARFACFFFRCPPNQKMCVCSRCGRTNHLWVEMPQEESNDFEFVGRNAEGQMVYTETIQRPYICSRCGEKRTTTTHKHVHH